MPHSADRLQALANGAVEGAVLQRSDVARLNARAPGRFATVDGFTTTSTDLDFTGVFVARAFADAHRRLVMDYMRERIRVNRLVLDTPAMLIEEARRWPSVAALDPAIFDAEVRAPAWMRDGGNHAGERRRHAEVLRRLREPARIVDGRPGGRLLFRRSGRRGSDGRRQGALMSPPARRFPAWALKLAGGVLLALLWELAGRRSQSLLLPSFSETLTALLSQLSDPRLWSALLVSNEALALGFAIALAFGIPLGLALGRWHSVDIVIHPYLLIAVVLPTTALMPVIFMLGGLGLASRVLVVCIFSLPVVAECARTAVRGVDIRLREMARAFGATPAQEWSEILLPATVPGIMTGVRLGLARAIEGMVVVELLLVAVGIGGLLLDYQGRFDAPHVYGLILVVMAEASLLSQAGHQLETAPLAACTRSPVMPAIDIRNCFKTYDGGNGQQPVPVLDGVNLSVAAEEFVVVLGPSGCGKTTLLRILAGLAPWDSGDVLVNGRTVEGPGPDRGMVFQDFALLPWATVRENVAFGLSLRGVNRVEISKRVGHLIEYDWTRWFFGSLPAPVVRRDAATRRPRSCARDRSGDPAAGRAIRVARFADTATFAGGSARPPSCHEENDSPRHPQCG